MIERTHQKGDAWSHARYSDCERYRYTLTRIWEPEGQQVLFVLLNPSTATEAQNDPTIERCERRARSGGFGAFRAVNLFALRSTDPRGLYVETDPVGRDNDAAIAESALRADRIVCAWGVHGAHMMRGATVEALLRGTGRPLWCLGLTKGGAPKHPLYLGYRHEPRLWPALSDPGTIQ